MSSKSPSLGHKLLVGVKIFAFVLIVGILAGILPGALFYAGLWSLGYALHIFMFIIIAGWLGTGALRGLLS